ncbi:MAG: PIN domain-containing protein [Cyanobacteria bacterium P01_A01_bin.40]
MKILVDSDWILELLLNRDQYKKEAEKLLPLLQSKLQVQVYATELSLKKIRSIVGHNNPQLGEDSVSWVKQNFDNRLLPFDLDIRDHARNLSIKDVESAIEVAIAQKENMGAIVTLNTEIFAGANLPILSANNLIERINLEKKWSHHNSPSLVEYDLQTIEHLNKLLKVEYSEIDSLKNTKKIPIKSLDSESSGFIKKNFANNLVSKKFIFQSESLLAKLEMKNSRW